MNQKISKLHKEFEGMQKYKSLSHKISSLKEDLARIDKEVLELEMSMDQEQKDVERLENGGFHTFALKVFGKYEETRNKEILEAAAATSKWQDKKNQLELTQERIYQLQKEQAEYRRCEENYQRLYEQRLQELLGEDCADQREILQLKKENAQSEHIIKEIQEALTAGEQVLKSLNMAKDSMESAHGWGTWDILGGGLLADLNKHHHIDEAKSQIEDVQHKMQSYKTELADVKMVLDLKIEIGQFDKFADFFFDGFFADLNMQKIIESSMEDITKAIAKVESLQSRLQALKNQETSRMKQRNAQIEQIVRQD